VFESILGQRIVGLLLLALGAGGTAWSWYDVLHGGLYVPKQVACFPLFGVLGLALLLYPVDMQKFRDQHGVDRPTRLEHYPPSWRIMIALALTAGVCNYLAVVNL
jgi:hypothetical protein